MSVDTSQWKHAQRWHSERVEQEIGLVRWGHYGEPLLLFPTAGGDAEEAERFQLIGAIWPFIEAGRVKVYSVDSLAGRALLEKHHSAAYRSAMLDRFDACLHHEVLPAIAADCGGELDIVTAGCSIGAFNAVAFACRHPDRCRMAIAMSGTYDLERLIDGHYTEQFYMSSPLHWLPNLDDGPQLHALRQRHIQLAFAGGRWEDPEETWRMANVLGARGVPNYVDRWGPEYDHDWPTWRSMLPYYLKKYLTP